MRRLQQITAAFVALAGGVCTTGAPGAQAVEWGAPIAVPGMSRSFATRVAVSAHAAIAVAGERECAGQVSVRYPEGRWAPVHALGGSGTLVSSPDIVFDARGRLLLVWAQTPRVGSNGCGWRGPYEVMAQTWTEAKGWGAVQRLGYAAAFMLAQPRLATDRRGNTIVAWRGYRRSGGRTLEAVSTRFRPAEHGWEPLRQTPGGGPYRDVTLDAKGNAYAVWT
ncbi:MAG: hypothetical protein WA484_06075, partial [Solirubrobacteraceae bacterium]